MKTVHKDPPLRGEEYNPENPIGEYIKRWAYYHGFVAKDINNAVGYSEKYPIFKCKGISAGKLFKLIEFMTLNSALTEEFYLVRFKQVITGVYRWIK